MSELEIRFSVGVTEQEKIEALKKCSTSKGLSPNLADPQTVHCLHCNKSYSEDEMVFAKENPEDIPLWMCKYYPKCDCGGIGVDIFREKFWANNKTGEDK